MTRPAPATQRDVLTEGGIGRIEFSSGSRVPQQDDPARERRAIPQAEPLGLCKRTKESGATAQHDGYQGDHQLVEDIGGKSLSQHVAPTEDIHVLVSRGLR